LGSQFVFVFQSPSVAVNVKSVNAAADGVTSPIIKHIRTTASAYANFIAFLLEKEGMNELLGAGAGFRAEQAPVVTPIRG